MKGQKIFMKGWWIVPMIILSLVSVANSAPPVIRGWILEGQSNMDQGRGPLDSYWINIPRNVIYLVDDDWSACDDECCYCYDNPMLGTQLVQYTSFKQQQRHGPEIALAYSIAKQYPNDLNIIIKLARSGTSMNNWQPDAPLYNLLLSHINEMKAKYPGIIWMAVFEDQGDSDAKTLDDANAFFDRKSSMIIRLREDLGLPDLPWFMELINQDALMFPYCDVVDIAQLTIPAHIHNVRVVPALWMVKYYEGTIRIHYTTYAQHMQGRLMWETYMSWLSGR